jgi:hypothetical protein
MLKVYQVIRRNGKWHALLPDSLSAIVTSDDRELLVRWATEVAQRQNGEVHVYDYTGKIQVICTYDAGVERKTVYSPAPPAQSPGSRSLLPAAAAPDAPDALPLSQFPVA